MGKKIDPEATGILPRERFARIWKYLNRCWGPNSMVSNVSWRVRGIIALALMLIIGALFLLPTVSALMNSTIVWITASILMAFWLYFILQTRTYEQLKDKGVISAIFGRHYCCEDQTWSVKLWRTGLALNIAAIATWGIAMIGEPATIAEWEARQNERTDKSITLIKSNHQRNLERSAKSNSNYRRCQNFRYTGNWTPEWCDNYLKAPYWSTICSHYNWAPSKMPSGVREACQKETGPWEQRPENSWERVCSAYQWHRKDMIWGMERVCSNKELTRKATTAGWYSEHKHDVWMWGGIIAIVLFLTIVVLWMRAQVLRPYNQRVVKLSKMWTEEKASSSQWRRHAEGLQADLRLIGEEMIAWEVILRLTKGRSKQEVVANVVRVRQAIEKMAPRLVTSEDRRDALRERIRRVEEEAEELQSRGEGSPAPIETSPS